jgi:quercetin dioxygenase-like cupin family protein
LAFLETPALATPSSGISVSALALANYGQIDVSPSNSTGNWHLQAKTNQATDVAVFDAVIDAGGYFGWHDHPGASWVTVTRGELTEYNSDGCVVTTYHAGDHFFEPANHVHDVRSSTGAEVIAVQFLPHGAPPVISQPAPNGCA